MFGGVNKSAAINIDKTDASLPYWKAQNLIKPMQVSHWIAHNRALTGVIVQQICKFRQGMAIFRSLSWHQMISNLQNVVIKIRRYKCKSFFLICWWPRWSKYMMWIHFPNALIVSGVWDLCQDCDNACGLVSWVRGDRKEVTLRLVPLEEAYILGHHITF